MFTEDDVRVNAVYGLREGGVVLYGVYAVGRQMEEETSLGIDSAEGRFT